MRNCGRGCARVDCDRLWARVDAVRRARQISSMRMVAQQIGVNVGTLSRLEDGRAPDAHNVAAILTWLGEEHWWIVRREDLLLGGDVESAGPSC